MRSQLRLPSFLRRAVARRVARANPVAGNAVRRRACIYKVDRLGDFVLALGALRTLVRHYGADECRLIVSEVAAPLAALEFPDVPRWNVPVAPGGIWREMQPLQREHAPEWAGERFDDLICLRHTSSAYRDITLAWIHAENWFGLGLRPTPDALTLTNTPLAPATYPSTAPAPWSRELVAHREVVRLAIQQQLEWPALRPSFTAVAATAGVAIVFCPFGSEPVRDYPEDAWIAAWREATPPRGPIQVIGPSARQDNLSRLADRLRTEVKLESVSVAVDLPLPVFLERLAGARGIVTVDSFAAHVATALDKPTVVLLGGGHFGWFGPWGGPQQRWLHVTLPCFGCNWRCQYPTVRCLTEIPPAAVAQAMREMLGHA